MRLATRLPRCSTQTRGTGGANDVVVYCCRTEQLESEALAAAVRLLSPGEMGRHGRLLFAADRRHFAVAHALLRCALTAQGDRALHEWAFVTGQQGKPQLSDRLGAHANLSFSITHTRGLVA
jgi:phosphopantetheinyl transferase